LTGLTNEDFRKLLEEWDDHKDESYYQRMKKSDYAQLIRKKGTK